MHPSQQRIEEYIAAVRNGVVPPSKRYLDELASFLASVEFGEGYAVGHFFGAAVIVPALRPKRIVPLGDLLVAWVRSRTDLFPNGEAQKLILVMGGSITECIDEMEELGAFDVGTMEAMLPRVYEGWVAGQRDIARWTSRHEA